MRKHGTERLLEERGEVFGRFAVADDQDTEGDLGVLRWSQEEGASLEIVNPTGPWPAGVGLPWITVHGVTTAGGALTLPHAWIKRRAFGRGELALHSSRLILDEHTSADHRWSRMLIRTAHLHEWLPETGLRWKRQFARDGQTKKLSVEWSPPEALTVPVSRGWVRFGPAMDSSGPQSPVASISTSMSVSLNPNRPQRLAELERLFAHPILALMTVAADRPDVLTSEIVRNPEADERAIVLHAGPTVESREWRPDHRFLFRAEDLDDVSASLRRWFRLWRKVAPAIEMLVDSINQGTLFSPARLLAVVAAAEAYHRGQLGGGGSLEAKLKALRAYGGVDMDISGCTNANLRLVVASRNWYSHLDPRIPGFSRGDIEDSQMESTRRTAALLQACLLRNLGVRKSERQRLFEDHYRAWPLS